MSENVSHPAHPLTDQVRADTLEWVDKAVIGLNLCPFAKGSVGKGRLQVTVSAAQTEEEALQAVHDKTAKPDFAARFAELDAFLHNALPAAHPLAGAVAQPQPPSLPERYLLGGSPDSAALAARHGWNFTYAGHFNGDPANIERSLKVYREAAGRAPSLALYALVAPTQAQAERLVGALRVFKLHLPTGQTFNLPSEQAAAEFARQAGMSEYRLEETRPHVIAGAQSHVREQLDALAERYGIEEFVVDTPVTAFADRLASVELLAGAFDAVAA